MHEEDAKLLNEVVRNTTKTAEAIGKALQNVLKGWGDQ